MYEAIHINDLPDEVQEIIFSNLNLKSVIASREVCVRWKQNVDKIIRNDQEWHRYCESDYSNVFLSAFHNAVPPGLKWQQLYKILTSWNRLSEALETKIQFSVAMNTLEKIINFQIVKSGIIGVLKNKGIIYYDVDKIQQTREIILTAIYLKYYENDDMIFTLDRDKQFRAVKKVISDEVQNLEINPHVNDVTSFIFIDNSIYCLTSLNMLVTYTFIDGRLIETNELRLFKTVIALGYANNTLHIMTRDCSIYAVPDNILTTILENGTYGDVLQSLQIYNFTKNIYWDDFFFSLKQMPNVLNDIPSLKNLSILHMHGPVLLAGYKDGVLRMFYSLYNSTIAALLQSEPIKECRLVDPSEERTRFKILNIDVIESDNSHMVLVALQNKMIVFKYKYPPTIEISFDSFEEQEPSGSGLQPPTREGSASSSYEQLFTSGEQSPSSIEQSLNVASSSSSFKEQSSSSGDPPLMRRMKSQHDRKKNPRDEDDDSSSSDELLPQAKYQKRSNK